MQVLSYGFAALAGPPSLRDFSSVVHEGLWRSW